MAVKLDTEKVTATLLVISDYLRTEMVSELQNQGHAATGELIASIENKINAGENFVSLEGWSNFYGRFVDTGRKSKIKRVPIDALERWILQKGFESDAKKVRGMAFAIQKTIFEKGISTTESWAGGSTKDWLTKTLDANEQRISNDIEQAVDVQLNIIFDNMIRETQSMWKTAA